MKLLSFEHAGRESWGAVIGNLVADFGRAFPQYPTLQFYLAAGRVGQASADAATIAADIPLAAILAGDHAAREDRLRDPQLPRPPP